MDARQTDRLQSLKAGLIGAGAIALFLPVSWLLTIWLLPNQTVLGWAIALHAGSALVAGFLFGVTYRYTVRQDDNGQLKSGTVTAFVLIRGLAIATGQWDAFPDLWQAAFGLAESVGLFAIAALALELAMTQGWLDRCQTPDV